MKLSKPQLAAIVILIIAEIGISLAAVMLTERVTIPNYAALKAVGIAFYTDAGAMQPATNITWGTVYPGMNYTHLLYCKNIKNSNATLTLTVGGWNPVNASTYIHCVWNYTGALLQPNQIIPIDFELEIASNVTGITNFSFNCTAIATAQ